MTAIIISVVFEWNRIALDERRPFLSRFGLSPFVPILCLLLIEFIDNNRIYWYRFGVFSLQFYFIAFIFVFISICFDHSFIVSRCHLLRRSYKISLLFDYVCPNPNLIHRRKRLFRMSIPLSRLASLPVSCWNWIPSPFFSHWNMKPSISLDFLLFGNGIALSIQRYCLECDVKIESILHFSSSGKPRNESNARIITYYYLHRKG